MVAPHFYQPLIEPPSPGMTTDEQFRWLYDVWKRTGGFQNAIANLNGLQASVAELNTLVGINILTTVQAQLNSKADISSLGTMAFQNAIAVAILGGTLNNVAITSSNFSGAVQMLFGSSGVLALPGALINTNVTPTGNVLAVETNLASYSLPSNSLSIDGDFIDIQCYGTFAANANNKQLRLYFGSTLIFDTGAVAANAGSWEIKASVAREDLADQLTIASIISSNALITPTTNLTDPSESLNTPILIRITGTGVANNDILGRGFNVKWFGTS